MALVTVPHSHPCDRDEPHDAPCLAAEQGGCLFPSYRAITCEAHEAQDRPLPDEPPACWCAWVDPRRCPAHAGEEPPGREARI